MPHKRAKRSVRLEETKKRGSNLPPSANQYDDAPRSAIRIINSWSTQSSFRANGGRSSEDTGEKRKRPNPSSSFTSDPSSSSSGTSKKKEKEKTKITESKPKIMPHESLADFNRRVEASLRSGVSSAIKSANSRKKLAEKEAQKKKGQKPETTQPVGAEGERQEGKKGVKRKHDASDPELTFKPAPGPRRLNDIAEAPPSLPHLRVMKNEQKGGSVWTAKGKGKSGLSVGQERLMEEERERVIKKYREMKAAKEEVREKERNASEAKKLGKVSAKGEKNKEEVREYQSDSD